MGVIYQAVVIILWMIFVIYVIVIASQDDFWEDIPNEEDFEKDPNIL